MPKSRAQGWYRDPYEIHEDRYFSAGVPTKLVRDEGQESYDPPPDWPLLEGDPIPFLDGDLIPARSAEGKAKPGSDQERADQPRVDPVWQQIGAGTVAPLAQLPDRGGVAPW